MPQEKKYPEVHDLRDRMKHYEFRRDEDRLMLTIRHFQVFDEERLRFTLSPCFNRVRIVLDKGPDSAVQHIANLYPPIRSNFDVYPNDYEEHIHAYQYGMNVMDGVLQIKFKVVRGLESLPKDCLEYRDRVLPEHDWENKSNIDEGNPHIITLKSERL